MCYSVLKQIYLPCSLFLSRSIYYPCQICVIYLKRLMKILWC
jgi:hypothetical protein